MSVELHNLVFTKIVLEKSQQALTAEQSLQTVQNLNGVTPVDLLTRELKKAEGAINETKKTRILARLNQIKELFP